MTDPTPATGTDPAPTGEPTPTLTAPATGTADEVLALCDELGVEPAQLKERLAASRKWEDRAKANAKAASELADLKRQGMSDLDAAVDKAKADTRAEVLGQFGSKLATEAVRAAAAGRVADVDALLEGIDASKFLGDDGDPDRDAIAAWVDRIAPKADEDATHVATFLDLGQGARGTTASAPDPLQKALEDLARR